MKKGLLLVAGLLVGAALLIGVFFTFPFKDLLTLLLGLRLRYIFLYLIVSFGIFLLLVLRWHVICRSHGLRIPWWHLVGYRYVGHAISFITPGPKVGGEPARAALMKRDDVKLTVAFSTVIADKTIELTSFGLMFVFALGFALFTLDLSFPIEAGLGTACLIVLVVISYGFIEMARGRDPVMRLFRLLRLHKIKWLRRYEKELRDFEKNIHGFYGDNKKAFWLAQGVSALAWTASLLEYRLLLLALGFTASFAQIFVIYSVVGAAYTLPVPLALGTLEASEASVFSALDFPAAAGAALALITRARDLLWTLVGFVLMGYYRMGFGGKK